MLPQSLAPLAANLLRLSFNEVEMTKERDNVFNVVSIILGIFAWLFAGFAIAASRTATAHKNTLVSFSLCETSLVFQLSEINRRVILEDYSAIEDTIQAVIIASVVLVAVTIVLNIIALKNNRTER